MARWTSAAGVGIAAAAFLSLGGACSSFGSDEDSTPQSAEAGATDGAAPGTDAAAVPTCTNPLVYGPDLRKFEVNQSADAGLDTTATSIHGTVTLPASAEGTAYVTRTIATSVSSVSLEYDVAVATFDVYSEFGCALAFSAADPNDPTFFPGSTLYLAGHTGTGAVNAELDDYQPDGAASAPVDTKLAVVDQATVHVVVTLDFQSAPGRVKGQLTYGKAVATIDVPVARPTKQVKLSCGLTNATSSQTGGTSDVTVSNVSATFCP